MVALILSTCDTLLDGFKPISLNNAAPLYICILHFNSISNSKNAGRSLVIKRNRGRGVTSRPLYTSSHDNAQPERPHQPRPHVHLRSVRLSPRTARWSGGRGIIIEFASGEAGARRVDESCYIEMPRLRPRLCERGVGHDAGPLDWGRGCPEAQPGLGRGCAARWLANAPRPWQYHE